MARNTLYQEIRQSHKKAGLSSKKRPESDGDTNNILSQPEAELYFQELTDAIETAKAKLTEKQLRALEASQIPEIDFDKISEELGCSKGTYKSRLERARKRIMELMAQYFIDKKS